MTDETYVVYYQRYPEDPVSQRSFSSKAEAEEFLRRKNDDYSYTVGQCWMQAFQPAGEERKP